MAPTKQVQEDYNFNSFNCYSVGKLAVGTATVSPYQATNYNTTTALYSGPNPSTFAAAAQTDIAGATNSFGLLNGYDSGLLQAVGGVAQDGSVSGTGDVAGVYGAAYITTVGGTYHDAQGVLGWAFLTGSTTMDFMEGVEGGIFVNGAGTVTIGASVYGSMPVVAGGGGAITYGYGIFVDQSGGATGAPTYAIGAGIREVTGGTASTNLVVGYAGAPPTSGTWNIFSPSARTSYFTGNIGMSGTAFVATSNLDIRRDTNTGQGIYLENTNAGATSVAYYEQESASASYSVQTVNAAWAPSVTQAASSTNVGTTGAGGLFIGTTDAASLSLYTVSTLQARYYQSGTTSQLDMFDQNGNTGVSYSVDTTYTGVEIYSPAEGGSSTSYVGLHCGATQLYIQVYGTGSSGGVIDNSVQFYTSAAGGIQFVNTSQLWVGATGGFDAASLSVNIANGDVRVGNGALPNNTATGFFWLPRQVDGPIFGTVPTAPNVALGYVPISISNGANKALWAYLDGAWTKMLFEAGGGISGGGAQNQITYWSAASVIAGRPSFTDDGTTLTYSGNRASVQCSLINASTTVSQSVALNIDSGGGQASGFFEGLNNATATNGAIRVRAAAGRLDLMTSTAAPLNLITNGANRIVVDSNGNVTDAQGVQTTGSPTAYTLTGAAHTTLTASVESIDVNYNLARTVQFATGALTTQRAHVIQAPTYAFVGASTITNAATVAITGAPAQGTNATITTSMALWVQSGNVRLGTASSSTPTLTFMNAGGAFTTSFQASTSASASAAYTLPVAAPASNGQGLSSTTAGVMSWASFAAGAGGTGSANYVTYWVDANTLGGRSSFTDTGTTLTYTQPAAGSGAASMWVATGGAHTSLTASTEVIDVNFNLARTVQWATGALTTQRAHVIQAPTYGFVGGSTITNAATVAITGSPAQGTNATITNAMALWLQAGNFAIGSAPTMCGGVGVMYMADGTIPTSNPTAGGIIYVDATLGLSFRGKSGTITNIAPP